MLALIVVLPLLIAALAIALLPKQYALHKYIALGAAIATLVIIVMLLILPSSQQSITWLSIANFQLRLSFTTATLNKILLCIVGIITPLTMLYSMGFIQLPSEQHRYYIELCAFAAAMLLFAIAADFITMFIGWEALGVTSYLLIGFWYRKSDAPHAARKAITIMLLGDAAMFGAMVMIWNAYGTFNFATIVSAGTSNLLLPLLLILVAVFTKSAQFPFEEWLPDAMVGPTPVSAFLHSTTMVKAGIFLMMVLLPLFPATILHMLIIIGIVTAAIGATNALSERHFKKVLAYSTVEDLGLMMVALGTGSLLATLTLFITQAFYKLLLFFSAGAIITQNNGKEQISEISGASREIALYVPLLIGVISIAGIFPLAGFFGKYLLLQSASSASVIAYALLLAIGFATNLYIFRWLILASKTGSVPYRRLTKTFRPAIWAAAALCIAASSVYFLLPGLISTAALPFNIAEAATETAVAAAGIGAAYYLFKITKQQAKTSTKNNLGYMALHNGDVVNMIYNSFASLTLTVGSAVLALDTALNQLIDAGARSFVEIGSALSTLESGNLNVYLLAFAIAMGLLIAVIIR